MSTGDSFSPGNFGLKDQSLALRWVNENIDAFGGDASSITLMGVSAGAAAVHMHMMSPLSQGLFHRAIVMSGSALAPYNNPVRDPFDQALEQAKLLGIEPFNSPDLIDRLRSLDAHTIVDSIDGMKVVLRMSLKSGSLFSKENFHLVLGSRSADYVQNSH